MSVSATVRNVLNAGAKTVMKITTVVFRAKSNYISGDDERSRNGISQIGLIVDTVYWVNDLAFVYNQGGKMKARWENIKKFFREYWEATIFNRRR